MAVSSDPTFAKTANMPTATSNSTKTHSRSRSIPFKSMLRRPKETPPPRASLDTPLSTNQTPHTQSTGSSISSSSNSEDLKPTNNDLPPPSLLSKIENLPLLDQDNRSVPFKTLYTGPNVTRRVLIIFIRHFFCGYCQEYVRSLSNSISVNELLHLPTPTFITIIGHGSASLIPTYQAETSCPFPIYADPTKKLYNALGMQRTHSSGSRPSYQSSSNISLMTSSFIQSLKRVKGGLLLKGGDYQQVGGEFLFEPESIHTPLCTPGEMEEQKELGVNGMLGNEATEEKTVTWCHRMRNTRDHAEIAELREVLGLRTEGEGLKERKGTGFSEFSARNKLVIQEQGSSGSSIILMS